MDEKEEKDIMKTLESLKKEEREGVSELVMDKDGQLITVPLKKGNS